MPPSAQRVLDKLIEQGNVSPELFTALLSTESNEKRRWVSMLPGAALIAMVSAVLTQWISSSSGLEESRSDQAHQIATRSIDFQHEFFRELVNIDTSTLNLPDEASQQDVMAAKTAQQQARLCLAVDFGLLEIPEELLGTSKSNKQKYRSELRAFMSNRYNCATEEAATLPESFPVPDTQRPENRRSFGAWLARQGLYDPQYAINIARGELYTAQSPKFDRWPVLAPIVSRYDENGHNRKDFRGNARPTLNTTFGSTRPLEVRAVQAGTVFQITTLSSTNGTTVSIQHDDGSISRYTNLDRHAPSTQRLQLDTPIKSGEVIGIMGGIDRHSDADEFTLMFQVRQSGFANDQPRTFSRDTLNPETKLPVLEENSIGLLRARTDDLSSSIGLVE